MRENDARPARRVDPDSFAVHIDGELVEADAGRRTAHGPAVLPLLTTRIVAMSAQHFSSWPTAASPPAGTRTPAGPRRPSRPGGSPDAASLEDFCRGRLHTTGLVAAALAAAAAAGVDPLALDEAADARTPVARAAGRRAAGSAGS